MRRFVLSGRDDRGGQRLRVDAARCRGRFRRPVAQPPRSQPAIPRRPNLPGGRGGPQSAGVARRRLFDFLDRAVAARGAVPQRRHRSRTASTAAASCSTCSSSTASRCRATCGGSSKWARASTRRRWSLAISCSSRTVAPGASHVGIAVGGDQFVHAPSSSGVVRVERLSAQYWASRFVGAKRVN